MWSSYIKHTAEYTPKMLGPDDVRDYHIALHKEFDHVRIRSVEIKYTRKSDRLTDSFLKFEDLVKLWPKLHHEMRGFEIVFSSAFDMKSSSHYYTPHLRLRQRYRTKSGDERLQLTLEGHSVTEDFFSISQRILGTSLKLERVPHGGKTWDELRFLRLWNHREIDPGLRNHITGAVDAGQYDTALKAAVSEVESRLREKCVAVGCQGAKGVSGADLAVLAYHKDKGCLSPPWPLATEASHGAQLLFQGFFLYIRNAYAHNSGVMERDVSCVYEMIMFCELLLRIISKSSVRNAR